MSGAVVIVGAGGHARVVADALLCAGIEVLGFIDRDTALHGTSIYGLPILGDDEALSGMVRSHCLLANGIGGVGLEQAVPLRRKVQERLEAAGYSFCGVRHPSAQISPRAILADDVQVFAGGVVQPGAKIARGVIINTRSIVEHDCQIGAFVHCAPGSVVCGEVTLEADVHVGAGAVIRQGLRLGRRIVVAAGAVVVADHPGPGTLLGVPARMRI